MHRPEVVPCAVMSQHARRRDAMIVALEFDHLPIAGELAAAAQMRALAVEREHAAGAVQCPVAGPWKRHDRADPRTHEPIALWVVAESHDHRRAAAAGDLALSFGHRPKPPDRTHDFRAMSLGR